MLHACRVQKLGWLMCETYEKCNDLVIPTNGVRRNHYLAATPISFRAEIPSEARNDKFWFFCTCAIKFLFIRQEPDK